MARADIEGSRSDVAMNTDRIRHLLDRSSAFFNTVTIHLEGEFSNIAEILTLDQWKLAQAVKGDSTQPQRILEASGAPTTRNKKQDLFSMESAIERNHPKVLEPTTEPASPVPLPSPWLSEEAHVASLQQPMRSQARWTVRQHLIVPVAVAATFGTMAGFLITRTQRLKWPLVSNAVGEI
ncbi:MFS general substrate transporter [Apiospora sp. TS-2023a]